MVWTPREALVVQAAASETGSMIRHVLSRLGFTVLTAPDFTSAKQRLTTRPPDLLVADVRLGAYNGLHLVFAGKAIKPALAAILVGEGSDGGLRVDVEEAGATLLYEPLDGTALAAAVRNLMPLPDGGGQREQNPASSAAADDGSFANRRDRQRRNAVEEMRQAVRALDLHGRLEEKRQKIERERRSETRRRADRTSAGGERPDTTPKTAGAEPGSSDKDSAT